MRKIIILISLLALLPIMSCDEENNPLDGGITDEEIIQGLKAALSIGTDSSVSIVSALNGYYGDEIIKILLPEEAEVVYSALDDPEAGPLLEAVGVDALLEDVILGINRTAEEAAKKVAPIFWDAITGLTIADGKEILYGADTAATAYLKFHTNDPIKAIYKPKLDSLLSIDLIGNTSTNELWVELTSTYNNVATSPAGMLAGINAIPAESTTEDYLAEHSTQKALDGLFLKVSEEEKRIRENPLERVTDILKKVFSLLD